MVDFFSRETRSDHYNFCLQKWTYFPVIDKQGIVLRALTQEVSFLSHYTNPNLNSNRAIKTTSPNCLNRLILVQVKKYLLYSHDQLYKHICMQNIYIYI